MPLVSEMTSELFAFEKRTVLSEHTENKISRFISQGILPLPAHVLVRLRI
jgi:hypothetical protein